MLTLGSGGSSLLIPPPEFNAGLSSMIATLNFLVIAELAARNTRYIKSLNWHSGREQTLP